MSIVIAGHVKNGLVVPDAPLPEGAQVEIRITDEPDAGREGGAGGGARSIPGARPVVPVPLDQPLPHARRTA